MADGCLYKWLIYNKFIWTIQNTSIPAFLKNLYYFFCVFNTYSHYTNELKTIILSILFRFEDYYNNITHYF